MSTTICRKRNKSFDESHPPVSKKRKTIPEHEMRLKAMTGVLPLMSIAPSSSKPEVNVVNKLRDIIATGLKSQKQIGKENELSQTLVSQYMNRASRVKGWNAVDKLLDAWADEFNEQLSKHTLALTKRIAKEHMTSDHEHIPRVCGFSDAGYHFDVQDNAASSTQYCHTSFNPMFGTVVDCENGVVAVQEDVNTAFEVPAHEWWSTSSYYSAYPD